MRVIAGNTEKKTYRYFETDDMREVPVKSISDDQKNLLLMKDSLLSGSALRVFILAVICVVFALTCFA